MNPIFANQPTSIFTRMSDLARAYGAVNLGQGFPDFGWPEDVVAKAAEALQTGSNQYAPMWGLPILRQAISDHYRAHQCLEVSQDQVIVTSGATEAIAAAILALVSPGDEVLLFQPLYDAYLPLVRRAGGVAKLVRLTPPDWRITEEALATSFSERTRLVIFNNPHNPTSRVFSADELALLAHHCLARDALVLSDEVWEHVVFDGAHIPLASLPGMAERTIKIGSAGKIFSLTGWKVGWAVAPPRLVNAFAAAHQFIAFSTPPPLQSAVAYGLNKEASYFDEMQALLRASRDSLVSALAATGFVTLPAQGSYFLSLDLAASGIDVTDSEFCRRAVQDCGVAAIPISAFYNDEPVTNVVRLCFAKQADTLAAGVSGLTRARDLFVA